MYRIDVLAKRSQNNRSFQRTETVSSSCPRSLMMPHPARSKYSAACYRSPLSSIARPLAPQIRDPCPMYYYGMNEPPSSTAVVGALTDRSAIGCPKAASVEFIDENGGGPGVRPPSVEKAVSLKPSQRRLGRPKRSGTMPQWPSTTNLPSHYLLRPQYPIIGKPSRNHIGARAVAVSHYKAKISSVRNELKSASSRLANANFTLVLSLTGCLSGYQMRLIAIGSTAIGQRQVSRP